MTLVRRASPLGELPRTSDPSTTGSNGKEGLAVVDSTTETARAGA